MYNIPRWFMSIYIRCICWFSITSVYDYVFSIFFGKLQFKYLQLQISSFLLILTIIVRFEHECSVLKLNHLSTWYNESRCCLCDISISVSGGSNGDKWMSCKKLHILHDQFFTTMRILIEYNSYAVYKQKKRPSSNKRFKIFNLVW